MFNAASTLLHEKAPLFVSQRTAFARVHINLMPSKSVASGFFVVAESKSPR